MADYTVIPGAQLNRNVFKLPDNLSFEEAATVEPIAVGAFSVRRAKITPENTCAVLGTGIIGLGIIQILKAFGISRIYASGRRESRLKAATECGADLVVDAAREDAVQAIKDATDGLGVEVIFDCAGTSATFAQSLELCRGGGKFIMVALYEQPITWNPYAAITKNITMVGVEGGHFPTALDLMASGKVSTKSLITHVYPLDEVKAAFTTQAEDKNAVKVVLKI